MKVILRERMFRGVFWWWYLVRMASSAASGTEEQSLGERILERERGKEVKQRKELKSILHSLSPVAAYSASKSICP